MYVLQSIGLHVLTLAVHGRALVLCINDKQTITLSWPGSDQGSGDFFGGLLSSVTKAAEDAAKQAKEAADGVSGKLNEATKGGEGAPASGGGGDWSLDGLWAKAQEAAQSAQKAALDVSIACPVTKMPRCSGARGTLLHCAASFL